MFAKMSIGYAQHVVCSDASYNSEWKCAHCIYKYIYCQLLMRSVILINNVAVVLVNNKIMLYY